MGDERTATQSIHHGGTPEKVAELSSLLLADGAAVLGPLALATPSLPQTVPSTRGIDVGYQELANGACRLDVGRTPRARIVHRCLRRPQRPAPPDVIREAAKETP